MSRGVDPSLRSAIREKVRHLPHRPGVYLMKDRLNTVVYVGKAKDLRKRVSTYFQPSRRQMIAQPKVRAMLDLIADFEIHETRSEAEALLLEGSLIKKYRPRYNTDFTDDKRFLLVRMDPQEEIPAFRLVRNQLPDGAVYFGPFAQSGMLRKTLSEMRRLFGVVLADARPVPLGEGRFRLYDDMRQELFPHPNEVTLEVYRERLARACDFLTGKTREVLEELEKKMRERAEAREYEEAAVLRDSVEALKRTLAQTRKFRRDPVVKPTTGQTLERLGEVLGLEGPVRTMECFDISHISGSFTVASMVHFEDGKPDRRKYRRFQIRSFEGNDDFRAMEEVVGRRYRRLAEEGEAFPDLVVIDGGQGQVSSAIRAFLILDLEPPPLIGLAKKRETIIFPDNRPGLNLSFHDPALRLLQHLRDEAHRFANSYNAERRSRKLRESVLDSMPGLGKVRRDALMEVFGNFRALEAASEEAIRAVPGIGPKLAAEIRRYLDKLREKDKNSI